MRPINKKLKEEMLSDPFYKVCLRKAVLNDHECQGRITFEHALIYAGRQVDERFAIIPICAYAHSVDQFQDGGILDKEINEWLALNRTVNADFANYPKSNWRQRLRYLNEKYGIPAISEDTLPSLF